MTFLRTKAPSGEFLTLASDKDVGASLRTYGEWSYGEIEAMRIFLLPGDNIVEVGSNIGSHTVFLGRDVVPKGRVFAFEPRRILHQMLCTNLVLNQVTNVSTYCLGAGSEARLVRESSLPLEETKNFGAWSIGELPGEGETIEIIPLDSMLDELPRISLIKADVEGAELDVLKGAQKLIERDRPVLYLENDRAALSPALLRHVASLGYRMNWHYVALFRKNNFAGETENIFGHTVTCSVLCVPGDSVFNGGGLPPVDDFSWHPFPPKD